MLSRCVTELMIGKSCAPTIFSVGRHSSAGTGFTWALTGCTVAPGFDFADFEMAKRAELIAQYPQHRNIIQRLTRDNETASS